MQKQPLWLTLLLYAALLGALVSVILFLCNR